MAKGRRVVIGKKAQSDRLPDWASEGAILTECLEQRGILEEIGKRLQVQREGGYVGLDVLLFFLFLFASGIKIGIKEFGQRTKAHRRRLAALGGRIHFPTPASVSRFLKAVNRQDVWEFGQWLLFEALGAREVLQHPSTMHRDTRGNGWHFFDWDPTSTVLRQRALPVIRDLPEGKRRAEEMESGYPGRKRGEVQLSRATLQHAGSGLWLSIWMAPGNGESKMGFDAAVKTIRSTCQQAGLAAENAVIRSDGQAGNVPYITACQTAEIHYVTRWGKCGLLEESEVREHLNESIWYEVVDSGSGPRRQATDLGWFMLPASPHTRQPDGSRYEPVRSRLVVSRFRTDKKRGSGVLIDGWHYELFATDLQAQPWPAAEVVTTYYGRCGQENRFRQEDGELGLDRIFSYHVPGQELANLIGLFVWNLRICHGMKLADPPCDVPPQQLRSPIAIEDPAKLPISTPTNAQNKGTELEGGQAPPSEGLDSTAESVEGSLCAIHAALPVIELAAVQHGTSEETIHSVAEPTSDSIKGRAELAVDPDVDPVLVHREPPDDPATQLMSSPRAEKTGRQRLNGNDPDQPTTPLPGANEQLFAALDRLDWSMLLKGKPNWTWDPKRGLVCPDGVVVPLTSVKRFRLDKRRHLRFKAPYGTCQSCELKDDCTSSCSPIFRREVSVSLPAHEAASIGALLVQTRPASATTRSWQNKDVEASLNESRSTTRTNAGGQENKAQDANSAVGKQKTQDARRDDKLPIHQPAGSGRQHKPPSHRSAMERIMPTWEKPLWHDDESPFSITSPLLLPAELRNIFRENCRGVETYVSVDPLTRPSPVRVFAITPGERQHRRLSWTQRHQLNQLPKDADISIQFADGFGIRPLMRVSSMNSLAA